MKKLICILVCVLFICVGFFLIETKNVKADITTGLVSYWNFNEETGNILYDQTIYKNNGTIHQAEWVSGIKGSALKFTNYSDIVSDIPSSWDNNIITFFSISSWIKWDGPNPITGCYIFDGRDDKLNKAGFILYINHSGKLTLRWSEHAASITSESNIPIGKWTHVVVIFDGDSNYFKIYINKKLDKIVTTNATYRDSTHSPAIGNNHWAPVDHQWAQFNGTIDELRIYNKVLTEKDIFDLYRSKSKLIEYSIQNWNFKNILSIILSWKKF